MHDQTQNLIYEAPASRGLATLALLKTNFDNGHDHIGMFQPFLVDAISGLNKDDFRIEEIKDAMLSRHGLAVPLHTLRTLLKRTCRRGFIRREFGRYFREPKFPASNIAEATEKIKVEFAHLATKLRDFLADNHQPIETDEEALALLLKFLERNHVGMVLDTYPDQTVSEDPASRSKTRLAIRFIKEVVPSNHRLTTILQRMLEGFILQNALLLKDISTSSRKFKDLRVFFDTRLVLQALGYQGESSQVATSQMIAMLKRTGARVEVFEDTIKETKTVLQFHQRHLGTSQGRSLLSHTPLSRFLLINRYTPADVAQMIALLDQSVIQAGFSIRPAPKRIARYTLDEADLAQRLAKTGVPEDEPRVWHDVNCVAAILTLRGATWPQDFDNAKAIFVTATGLVIKNVVEWFRQQLEEEHLEGKAERLLPPVVHHIALSNVAWLKLPASGQKLKLNELMALCSAALQPSRKTWDQFKRHLRNLQDSGVVSSDETVAILANQFTDVHLSQLEDHLVDETDIDSNSLNEVIERVSASYAAVAQEYAAKVRQAEERNRNLQRGIHQRASKISTFVTQGVSWLLAAIVIVVLLLSLPGFPGPLHDFALPLLLCLNALNLLFGFYVFKHRASLQVRLTAWIQHWLTGAAGPQSEAQDSS